MKKNSIQPQPGLPASIKFLPWLLVLFIGSGCAALIYEVVWQQLLQLVIGSSGISLGLLLGTFMAGMCLGSLLLPRWMPPSMHPLRVYAYLEFGIGIIGILVLFGMPLIADIYTDYLGHGVFMRAIVAATCLLPPTLLMGATLPAIARWVETTRHGVSWMGYFYGGNIAGAVIGCLSAGFYLLRLYDMPTATYVAVAINFAVAGFALLLSSRTPVRLLSEESEKTPVPEKVPSMSAVHLTIAMSGLCALGAEVIWTRLLSLMLGATVYTFSIILAVFLIGLGIGSSIGAYIGRNARAPRVALGISQLLAGVAVAWAAFMIARSLPYWPINPTLTKGEWGPWYTFQLDIIRAGWAVLPAALLWGASFPLALASVASRGQDPGRMVAGVYASNTVGAILGALAFSMIVIPQVGTQWSQRCLIVLAAVSALIALYPYLTAVLAKSKPAEGQSVFSLRSAGLTLVTLGLLPFLALSVAPLPWISVAFGRLAATWMASCVPGIIAESEIPVDGGSYRYCTYVGEGMNVSVAVTKTSSGWRYFHGAGKVQASSEPEDMRLQRMLGHLSVLARSNPDDVRDVLVVACGAGVTAGSFVPYPSIKSIVICDIEPLVPKVVTPMFGNENYHVVDGIDKENPHVVRGKQVRVVYDDGRHYIRTLGREEKFDIITSDPIDPWVKGCAALNTIEYYKMCKSHLKAGGIMSLWIPFYESNEETTKSVIATFFEVFPNGILFSNDNSGAGYDAVLLGQAETARIDIGALQSRLDRNEYSAVRQSLLEAGFGTGGQQSSDIAVDLLATFAGSAADLKDWMRNAQINTDRNLRLQYLAGMWVNTYAGTEILQAILKHYRYPDAIFAGTEDQVQSLREALAASGRHERTRP
jgi:spermidine synthase